jgi:hypothetical protein
LSAGDKVLHENFGDGVVVNSSGIGGDTQVTVAFAGHGVKRLMLSFAPLKKVGADSGTRSDTDRADVEIPDPDLFSP